MTENNVSLNALFQFSFWYISLWLSSKRQFHDEINIFSGKVTKRFRCIRKSLHNIFMMIRHREQIPQSETLVRSWLIPFIPHTYTYPLKGNPRQSWILDSTPRILDPRYWIPDSLSCIPDSKVPDSGSHKQKFSGFWNRDSLIWPGRATPQVIVAFSADRVRNECKWYDRLLRNFHVYVVVIFSSQVFFVFLLFLGMVMYANEVETKEK